MTESSDIERDMAAVGRIEAVPELLRVLCRTTGMGFAAVARVTDGSWTACAVLDEIGFGLAPGGQLDISTTLCKEVREARTPIVIDHASQDPVYCDHRTTKMYAIESYISVPIVMKDGSYFGNLCAIDPRPAKLAGTAILSMFQLFAQLVALQLAAELERDTVRRALLDEQQSGELREQFIAVLGHDLRTPLSAVAACGQLIGLKASDPEAVKTLAAKIGTNVKRMASLIDDVMDFARGRLGGGIDLGARRHDDIGEALLQVIVELRDAHPGRTIGAAIDVAKPVLADKARLQQLTSNLVANALTHGAVDGPVEVSASIDGHDLVIEVWNDGEPIPAASIGKIFAPFWRRSTSVRREGLGLGLHICEQISQAHGGRVQVTSTREDGTRFTARLPVVAAT